MVNFNLFLHNNTDCDNKFGSKNLTLFNSDLVSNLITSQYNPQSLKNWVILDAF